MPRGIPNSSKPGPKHKWKQSPELIKIILDELEEHGETKTACEIAMITVQTLGNWCKDDPILHAEVNKAKAKAIRKLVSEVRDQKQTWKILKNVGKDRFKEMVEVDATLRGVTELDPGDGSSDEFNGY